MITNEGGSIVHVDEMGLRQLAYPINKRSTGVYYSIEFAAETGNMISKVELALKRDERIMRFLTVSLDKFAVKYNDDKRNGKIGKKVKKEGDMAVVESVKAASDVYAPVSGKGKRNSLWCLQF